MKITKTKNAAVQLILAVARSRLKKIIRGHFKRFLRALAFQNVPNGTKTILSKSLI